METLTRQLVCIAILALFGSTLALTHVIKPPPKSAGLRKLQMDRDNVPQVNNFGASHSTLKTDDHVNIQKDLTDAKNFNFSGDLGMSDRGIYGGGYGSGGYEKSNTNLGMGMGMGVNCQCHQNGFLKHYIIDPVHLLHIDTTDLNMMKPDGLKDMAPKQPGN